MGNQIPPSEPESEREALVRSLREIAERMQRGEGYCGVQICHFAETGECAGNETVSLQANGGHTSAESWLGYTRNMREKVLPGCKAPQLLREALEVTPTFRRDSERE